MARFLLKRIALAAVTLFFLSVIVFATAQLLPGDLGRNVLGGFATQQSVDQLNHQLGVDRPVYVQYASWITKFVRGDLGDSLEYRVSVWSLLRPSLLNSLKLAALAFVLVVPISILGGIVAALRRGRPADRFITIVGLTLTSIPEFLTAIALIVILGIELRWLPVGAAAPPDAGVLVQAQHLVLPSLALVAVLFGYIARIARAGMIEALDADYTRTAYLKGLSTTQVIRRHVLRNALLPTIAVTATQAGYLVGGLLVIEKLFNYNGIGQRIYVAAQNKDYAMLQASVMIIGVIFLLATLIADIVYALLNPRIRYGAVG